MSDFLESVLGLLCLEQDFLATRCGEGGHHDQLAVLGPPGHEVPEHAPHHQPDQVEDDPGAEGEEDLEVDGGLGVSGLDDHNDEAANVGAGIQLLVPV